MPTTPGFPRMTPPAYSVPTFTSAAVALNAAVTDVRICSTASSAETNKPFTFGQVFKKGDIAPGDFLVGRIAGEADIPLQFNVKATHFDGSVRHAVISGVLPALGAGAVKTMALIRSAVGASITPAASSTLTAGGFSALVTLDIGGAAYTANPETALAANIAANKAWLAGEVETEFSVMLPLIATADGATHAHLEAQFNIRRYPGANAVKADITIEHTGAYTAIEDISYTASISIAGVQRYSAAITHVPCGRWKKTFWWNNANPVYVKHNIAYLIGSKQIPNYDQRVSVKESTLAGYATQLANTDLFKPMGSGPFTAYMPATGGRPDIGLLPGWAAAAVLSMDKRALDITHAAADIGGSWRAHMRDRSDGPGKGMPQSAINWYCVTELGGLYDSLNYETEQFEKWPGRTSASAGIFTHDESHNPNIAYLSYLLTGDFYYLEELQFWGVWIVNAYNPGYRLWERGLLKKTQTRGQAWGLRNLGECAALTPDSHYLKSHFKYWVDENLKDYNATYTDNPGANVLGVLDGVDDRQYHGFGNKPGARNGVGNFQDDFFTAALGHLAELGFTEASRLMGWKKRYPIGRMIGQGMCFNQAALQCWRISEEDMGPVYGTFGECLNGTVGSNIDGTGLITAEMLALPCNSQARIDVMNANRPMPSAAVLVNQITGYSDGTHGYTANMQPSLAVAVDADLAAGAPLDGDLAWDQFDNRAAQPDYGLSPQFAIVPRGEGAATVTLPADNYTIASGQTMYFGRASSVSQPPPPVAQFDELTYTDHGDAVWGAQAGKPMNIELHGSSGQPYNGRIYHATTSGEMAFMGDNTFDFSLVPAWDGEQYWVKLRPHDLYTLPALPNRESGHIGLLGSDGKMHLVSERRYDAMMAWCDDNMTVFDQVHRFLSGGSMGGWGTVSYGVRRYDMFAALFPDRPRWRYGYTEGTISVATPQNGFMDYTIANAPMLSDADGGGSFAEYIDMIAYISNPANKVRPILWCIGRRDGYALFSEQIAAVDALRATGRAFAFTWNDGDHAQGSLMHELFQSYKRDTYSRNHGWPVFTEHSRDQDPRVDLVGGINIGLTFKSVVETANGWSCEVTNILGPCTVKVKPQSDVFTANVPAQLVTIPAAGTYVTVNFTA